MIGTESGTQISSSVEYDQSVKSNLLADSVIIDCLIKTVKTEEKKARTAAFLISDNLLAEPARWRTHKLMKWPEAAHSLNQRSDNKRSFMHKVHCRRQAPIKYETENSYTCFV